MLAEPLPALTDLALGLVTVTLAFQLHFSPATQRHWRAAYWWFGIAALAGCLHHGVIVRSGTAAHVSWTVISIVVVIAVSYVLAATVAEVLGHGRVRLFWLLRSFGPFAYVAVAISGHASIAGLMACESVTMLSVIALWLWAAHRQHPDALPVLGAIVASGAAASLKALAPVLFLGPLRLDPTSAYHLAQIAGTLLLYLAITEAPTFRRGKFAAARAPS